MPPILVEIAETGSTNDWLAVAPVAQDELWVRAERQTGARGRRGRAWTSIEGNLFASVLICLAADEGPAPQLSLLAAVALDQALQMWIPAERLALKWPNDLLLDGTKLSGILLEGVTYPDCARATIIGFGVNLVGHPEGTERPATSLAAAGLAVPSAHDVAQALMLHFAALRQQWRTYGFAPIRAAWLGRASGVGQRIEARLGQETLVGRFDGLDADGALLLTMDTGAQRAIHAGEVFQL